MIYIILLFGVLTSLGGVVLIIRPEFIFSILTKYGDSLSLQIFAVIVRILFGVALVIGASESKYPIVLQIFGWLLISAALVIGGIGRERFKKVVKWSVKLPTLIYRLASALSILFGCFLIYAVV
ncbi:hypothetical protein IH922_08695 [candidate division KSB1 bacterium]|jgi:hypothetical protein|nr:hypothetical protein [candidate division KSB1 bacterium]